MELCTVNDRSHIILLMSRTAQSYYFVFINRKRVNLVASSLSPLQACELFLIVYTKIGRGVSIKVIASKGTEMPSL